jgi:hypothetical protein
MRKLWTAAAAALTLAVAQGPALAQQYGPPTSGSSAALLFTPATVNLVAGLNGQGSSGNGGLATAAKLNYPVGIAYDSSGNLFVADGQNYVGRRIDHVTQDISVFAGTSGTFGDSLGGGVATSAQLGILAGLVIDTSNNVYVSDRSNNLVWKITPGGAISVYAGGGSSGLCDGGPATSGKLNNPWALGIDASNNIYISDSYNDLIRVVNHSTNIITTFAGVVADAAGGFGSCSAGSLYSTSTPPYTPTQAHLCFPQGIAFDSSGNAYIVDISNHIVRVVNSSTGYISTYAGGGAQPASVNGIPATSASLSPSGVYVDPANRVYIADSSGSLVRVVDSSGNINTVFGNGFEGMVGSIGLPDTGATVNNVGPADGIDDMAMDPYGNLIASDSSEAGSKRLGEWQRRRDGRTPAWGQAGCIWFGLLSSEETWSGTAVVVYIFRNCLLHLRIFSGQASPTSSHEHVICHRNDRHPTLVYSSAAEVLIPTKASRFVSDRHSYGLNSAFNELSVPARSHPSQASESRVATIR